MERFVAALDAAVAPRCAALESAADAARRCLAEIDTSAASCRSTSNWLPACEWVPAATARLAASDLAELGESIVELASHLGWYRRVGLAAGPEFADGHANAIVVGRGGIIERDDVMIGLTVMAPHVLYADHHHPPEEVYLVLSAGSWRQNDGPWREPGIGGIVYNPPDIIHSMRSGPQPLLAIWMLPGAI